MDWHPTLPKTLAVASKSGDIALWSYEKTAQVHLIKGVCIHCDVIGNTQNTPLNYNALFETPYSVHSRIFLKRKMILFSFVELVVSNIPYL